MPLCYGLFVAWIYHLVTFWEKAMLEQICHLKVSHHATWFHEGRARGKSSCLAIVYYILVLFSHFSPWPCDYHHLPSPLHNLLPNQTWTKLELSAWTPSKTVWCWDCKRCKNNINIQILTTFIDGERMLEESKLFYIFQYKSIWENDRTLASLTQGWAGNYIF